MLTESIKIKNKIIKNRLVMPPMATAKAGANGEVSEALCSYYKEMAAGGYIVERHAVGLPNDGLNSRCLAA